MTDEEVAEMIEDLIEDGFFIRLDNDDLRFTKEAEFLHPEIYRVLMEEHCKEVDETLWKMFHDNLLNIAGTNEEGDFLFH